MSVLDISSCDSALMKFMPKCSPVSTGGKERQVEVRSDIFDWLIGFGARNPQWKGIYEVDSPASLIWNQFRCLYGI